MNLAEWAAIEALAKRGDVDPLRQLLKERGLSSFLINAITEFALGIRRRPRHRPTKTFPGIIRAQYQTIVLLDPTRKKTSIHATLAKLNEVSVKTVEKVLYPKRAMSPKSKKKQSPST